MVAIYGNHWHLQAVILRPPAYSEWPGPTSGHGTRFRPLAAFDSLSGEERSSRLPELVLLYPPGRRFRQRRPELPEPRHLEARQARGRELAQLVLADGPARHDERLDLLSEHRVRHADHRHLRHARVLPQHLLDQRGGHVLAAAADDVPLAVDEVEPAVLVEPADVAGQEPVVAQRE